MRIGIVGQNGWGNVGDEGVLLAIMDTLGPDHEYIVSTSLPFTMTEECHRRIPNVVDVRPLEDARTDFDVLIYGGGKVDWGFAWSNFLNARAENIPIMAYGISLRADQDSHCQSYPLYGEYFSYFDAITVRDMKTESLLDSLFIKNSLTMCPAINLKEERTQCPENMIAVCPRFGDYNEKGEVDNEPQINWIVSRLKDEKDEVMLIPFFPKDKEGNLRDLLLCQEISKRLGGGCYILPSDGYNSRKIKYAISKSKLVISGGRYHAIVWAAAHDVPYQVTPTISEPAKSKLHGFIDMHGGVRSGKELKEMEKKNLDKFKAIT